MADNSRSTREILARARFARETESARAVLDYLRRLGEQWREELVAARGEDIPRLQGAVGGVREALRAIESDPVNVSRADGAYS